MTWISLGTCPVWFEILLSALRHTARIRNRLGGCPCPGWSDSLLCVQIILSFTMLLLSFCNHTCNKLAWMSKMSQYRKVPKISDRQVWANSVDPDQSDRCLHCLPFLLRLFTLTQYCMVKPLCSNFRIITATFSVSEFLGILRYIMNGS